MGKTYNVISFSKAAGGAAAIAPVCKAMKDQGWNVLVLAKDEASSVFEREGLTSIDFPSFNDERLEELARTRFGSLPDLVFTSATNLPAIDMTEKYLWRWGRNRKIPTVGVLDQWQSYGLRFSGNKESEKLAYLPDRIFVMDDLALEEMVKEGIDRKRIEVTGQPAFDRVLEEHRRLSQRIGDIKKRLGIPEKAVVITFISEALKKDLWATWGYEEQSTLKFIGDYLEAACRANKDLEICLVVKLHPENWAEEFTWALSKWPSFKTIVVKIEVTSHEVVEISDLVVGMSSILLVEAILIGKIAVSLQLNSKVGPQSAAAKKNAIPFITTEEEAGSVLEGLLFNSDYREGYLKKEQGWNIKRGGTNNCLSALKGILGKPKNILRPERVT